MIPLSLDYNLFIQTEEPPPGVYYKMEEIWPVQLPLDMKVDIQATADALLFPTQAPLSIPLSGQGQGRGQTLYLLTAGYGGLDSKDIAADATLRYADGRSQQIKWMVGEHIWPAWAGASGRSADPVALGKNAGGDVITASLLTVPLAFPNVPLEKIDIKGRPGSFKMALMALSLSPDPQVTIQAEVWDDPAQWYDYRIPSHSPLSIPALQPEAPTGRWGRVEVRDGHLAWSQGGKARFWGVNLVEGAAIPLAEMAETEAAALASWGFNLVRLHHIDGEGILANPKRGQPDQPGALAEGLDRLDRFVAALGRQGIYVKLETLTRRSFKSGEGVTAPEGVAVGNKLAIYLWPDWLEAEKKWLKELYDRVNPYTGLRYADDPTIALFEVANENSLLVSWNTGAIERLPDIHRARLDQLWNQWLRRRYKNDAALSAAWAGRMRGGLIPGETLLLESVSREPYVRSRTELFPTVRGADLARFYTELERAHQQALAEFIRKDLGFKVPLICNTSFGLPLADAVLGDCEVIDLHLYWDPIAETQVFNDSSLIRAPGRFIERLSWCQDGKPCIASEVNHAWPNRQSQEAPLWWASMAARQDFDAVIWFAWSHTAFRPVPDGPDGALDLEGRFNAMAQLPAAAALFRGGSLAPAPRHYVRWWSPDALLRDLAEAPGLWLDPQVGWQSLIDNVLRTSFAERPAPIVPSPSVGPAPIQWSPKQGSYTIETPILQALLGDTLYQQTSRLASNIPGFTAISLLSLDGQPLNEARKALLTLVGRCEREGTRWSTGGPGLLVLGKGPARMEQLTGQIRFRWQGRPQAQVLGADGQPQGPLKLQRQGKDWWALSMAQVQGAWVQIETRP